jgi:uncharacterized membrane protein
MRRLLLRQEAIGLRLPFAPLPFALLVLGIGLLALFVQLGALRIAFDKLGLSEHSALMLLMLALAGSLINIPLFTVRAESATPGEVPWMFRGILRPPHGAFHGRTLIAVNIGGCVVPVAFSLYLLSQHALGFTPIALATAFVATVARLLSRPIPRLGIGMPLFVAPLAAAVVSVAVDPQESAALAYVSGTLGVLIGADLLRLNDIRRLGAPFASIGGAGTFDGIFLTGVVAVLLA